MQKARFGQRCSYLSTPQKTTGHTQWMNGLLERDSAPRTRLRAQPYSGDTTGLPVELHFFEGRTPWDVLVSAVIQVAENRNLSIILSSLGYAEVLCGYYQAGEPDAAKEFNRFLFQLPQCEIISIDSTLGDRAAQLRAKYRLKLPDAIQLAVMEKTGAGAFITNDKDFRTVKDFPIIFLDDFVH